MQISSKLKNSGGHLIALALLQGQTAAASAAVTPAPGVIPSQVWSAQTNVVADDSLVPAIAALEKKYFEHDFHSENIDDRLIRLEQLLFGEARPGEAKDRLLALENLSGSVTDVKATSPYDKELTKLEQHYFQHDFHFDSAEQRLERLEQLAFGAIKKGDVGVRITKLQSTLAHNPDNFFAGSSDLQIHSASMPSETKSTGNQSLSSSKTTFNSTMDSGIRNFKNQRFHHAQEDFEKAISLNPNSAEAYANLAGALLKLNDRLGAQEAFKASYALQPFGKIGAYTRDQILRMAQQTAYANRDTQDTPAIVTSTTRTINRQMADRSRMYQSNAMITATNRLNLTQYEIQKLDFQTQLTLADLRAGRIYGGYGGYYRQNRGYVDPYYQQEVSNMNYLRTNWLRSDGLVQANYAANDGLLRSASVFESGTNLKDQMMQPSRPGSAHLRALGTSLYARYYGDGTPSTDEQPVIDAPLPALTASPKRLSSR